MLKQISNPFSVISVGFPSGNCLHVSGIDNHRFEFARFKDVIKRLPVRSGTFHGDHLAIILNEPVSQTKKFFGGCSEFSKFLLSAAAKAGNHDFLMYINTTTTLIDSIHEITSWYKLQRGSLT